MRSLLPPIGLHERFVSGNGLTIEALLTTADLSQVGPARIVSYSQDHWYRNFTLGQQNGDLIFRLRTTKTDLNGTSPEITVPGVFVPEAQQHIVISYDFSHCHIYIDGQLRDSVRVPGGTFSNWDPDHRLVIGNEQTGDRPWIGSIDRVVIYAKPISVVEVLESYQSGGMPPDRNGVVASFEFSQGAGTIIHDTSGIQPAIDLELPYSFKNEGTPDYLALRQRNIIDFIGNFAIFFPFGFLLFLNLSDKFGTVFQTMAATLFVALLFSLITESLQYYVEARTSSLFDFTSCLAGSLVGSFTAIASKPFFQFS